MDIFRCPRKGAVIALLKEADLPILDITDGMLGQFFGCGTAGDPCGVVGLEVHGSCGLLRSLVVKPSHRGTGCGKALVDALESYATHSGIESVYLLTETAEPFFSGLGYSAIGRADLPEVIKATQQFSSLCPDTATAMWKSVHANQHGIQPGP